MSAQVVTLDRAIPGRQGGHCPDRCAADQAMYRGAALAGLPTDGIVLLFRQNPANAFWNEVMKNKMKRHKGLKKRIRVTAKGKIKWKHRGTSHLMSSFSGDRKRNLRGAYILDEGKFLKNLLKACPEA